jgi:hypothetical protein
MIAEAARMKKDAQRMHPAVNAAAARSETIVPATETAPVAKKRGRTSKVADANAVQ